MRCGAGRTESPGANINVVRSCWCSSPGYNVKRKRSIILLAHVCVVVVVVVIAVVVVAAAAAVAGVVVIVLPVHYALQSQEWHTHVHMLHACCTLTHARARWRDARTHARTPNLQRSEAARARAISSGRASSCVVRNRLQNPERACVPAGLCNLFRCDFLELVRTRAQLCHFCVFVRYGTRLRVVLNTLYKKIQTCQNKMFSSLYFVLLWLLKMYLLTKFVFVFFSPFYSRVVDLYVIDFI